VTATSQVTTPAFRQGDPDLIARAQAGDEDAFEVIFGQYRAAIYNFLYRQTGDANDADDFTADTFLKAWLALPNTSDDLRIGAWLYRIAQNVWLDAVRHRRLVQWQPWESFLSSFHPSQVADDSPEREALTAEGAAEVRAVLAQMKPEYAELLELREFSDRSYQELAADTGRSWAAVKSMLFRARDEFSRVSVQAGLRPFGRDLALAPKRRLGGAGR
jgi:RNA polymerase sigma-70 factor (ECF subfamily)